VIDEVGTTTVTITSSPFTSETLTGGAGGTGTAGAGGGSGSAAFGGAIDLSGTKPGTATLTGSPLTANTASGGAGGAGKPFGGRGGAGGLVEGGALAALNYNLSVASSTASGNTALGGAGGAGGQGSGKGGSSGAGGSALGGGIFFGNTSGKTLTFAFTGSPASNNKLQGGNAGVGGNSSAGGGANHVAGGAGGAGGQALGGSVAAQADAACVNTITVTTATLEGNVLIGGNGGNGGQGENATGGAGGLAAGGSIYATSLNATTPSTLAVTGDTMAGNQLTGGAGGIAGSGTTSNGGDGGAGGNGGSAQGGGLFSGTNTTPTVINSTFGGLSADPMHADANRNILTVGNGGRGGNGGTAGNTLAASNGGNGGDAGKAQGGGVYVTSGTATFVNDTIVANEAFISLAAGAGGAGGAAAGDGTGTAGTQGADGAAAGGGYFSLTATNKVGNTIIDLNNAGSSVTGTFVTTNPDVSGTFTSSGHNIIGSTSGATGFVASDVTGVSATLLKLGPMQNNGGPTPTDGLLSGGAAVAAGDKSLLPATVTTDQRGPGHVRVFNNQVDVGAFELQPPVLSSISPNSANEGPGPVTMTLTGTLIEADTQVSFGGVMLTPASFTETQLTVVIPANLLVESTTTNVAIADPDSANPGQFILSNTLPFSYNEPATLAFSYGNQTNNEGDTVTGLASTNTDTDASGFAATGLPAGLKIDAATGKISGTIDPRAAGTYTVNVTATDDGLAGGTAFTWTVNDSTPPALTNPGNQTNFENTTISMTIGATDADSFSATNLPTALSIDNTGKITGTIANAGAANFNTTITASDGAVTSSVSFTWAVVAPPTQPPSFTPGPDVTVLENAGSQPVQNIANWATNLSPGPNQANLTVQFLVANNNNSLFAVQPTISPTGTLSFQTAKFAAGTATVTVFLKNSGGAANGGHDTFGPVTFKTNVTPVNQPPTFTAGPDQIAAESKNPRPQTAASWATNISPGPSNESGQSVHFIVTNDNNALFAVQPAISPTGTLTYQAASGASGTAKVTALLMDNGGTANGGVDTSKPATFHISVMLINPQPAFTADGLWVAQAFRDLVKREAQASDLAYWTNQLENGLTRFSAAQLMTSSTEYRTVYVNGLYNSYVQSPLDDNGRMFLLGLFNQGGTPEQVKAQIFQSAAYIASAQQRYGAGNFGLLSGLYHDILGRTLDESGRVFWGTQMAQGMSPYNVALNILNSQAAEGRVVQLAYPQFLGRAADAGAASWTNALVQGMRDEDFYSNLIASAEYGLKTTANNYNSQPDQTWLNQVFLDTLGRGIDPAGLGFFITQIRSGTRRGDITQAIVSSGEFRTRLVQGLATTYLNHPLDPNGANYFEQILANGGTVEEVKAQMFQSAEYFSLQQKYGTGNFGFLVGLFQNVLAKSLDENSRVYWGTKLAQGESRHDVALEILRSPDGLGHLVGVAYGKYLLRSAGPADVSYWTTQLQTNVTDLAFYAKLLSSHEYYVTS
jgi:hypothetical protein